MGVATTAVLWWLLSMKQALLIQNSGGWEASEMQRHSFWVLRRQLQDRPFSFCSGISQLQFLVECDALEGTFNAAKGCLYAGAAAAARVNRLPHGAFSSHLAAIGVSWWRHETRWTGPNSKEESTNLTNSSRQDRKSVV